MHSIHSTPRIARMEFHRFGPFGSYLTYALVGRWSDFHDSSFHASSNDRKLGTILSQSFQISVDGLRGSEGTK